MVVKTHHLSMLLLITWQGAGTASLQSGMLTERELEPVEVRCCCQPWWLQISYRDWGKDGSEGEDGATTLTEQSEPE